MRTQVLIFTLKISSLLTLSVNSQTLSLDHRRENTSVRTNTPSELGEELHEIHQINILALETAEQKTKIKLAQNIEVYFNTQPSEHNGLATALPRNRIFVHTEAPQLNSSIGLSSHYIFETLLHEWVHVLSFQHHTGVFKPLSWILGNTSRPNGAWPSWIHEGIAVWGEEAAGGRPKSGSINFDLRRYSEAAQRTQSNPLSNSDLDGQWALESFRSGQVPYSFGYLIWKKLTEQHGADLISQFATSSSSSLGISFRKTLANINVDLDKTFSELQEEWRNFIPPAIETHRKKPLSKAQSIKGLSVYQNRIAWIEEQDSNRVYIVNGSQQTNLQKIRWPFLLFSPQTAYPIADKQWLVSTQTHKAWLEGGQVPTQSQAHRYLSLWREGKKSFECQIDLGERVREFHVYNEQIIWTQSTPSGKQQLHHALWSAQNCQLTQQKLILETPKAFQRISSPRLSSQGYSYQLNVPNLEKIITEKIYNSDNRSFIANKTSGDFVFVGLHENPESNTALIHERSQDQWGPIYLEKSPSGDYESKRIPISTGAWEAILLPQNQGLLVVESFWDRDEVSLWSNDELKSLPKQDTKFEWSATNESNLNDAFAKDETIPETRSALSSLWPHFWIPSLLASDGGWLIAGQTFYSDLSSTWSGSSFLGYGSHTQRPFAQSSLAYEPLALSTSATYNPRDVSFFSIPNQKIQEYWNWRLSKHFNFSFSKRWIAQGALTYTLNYYGQFDFLKADYTHIPSLHLTLRTPYAQNPQSTLSLLSDMPSFVYFSQQASWIDGFEYKNSLSTLVKTSSRTRWLSQLEFAHTDRKNFPQSYFTWGGLVPLAASYSYNYLNRGFAPQSVLTRHLLRANTEALFRIWNPQLSFSWNRFRVQSLDWRLIAEGITWSPLNKTPSKLGDRYAFSVGSEIDLVGSALHYTKYKFSTGVFHGFGDRGETRLTAALKIGLDL